MAIIITIMVLELKVPDGEGWFALVPLWPVFVSYALSFVNVGIYWTNHHHLFQAVTNVGGWVQWANMHLLFWLSLMPFATGFMAENQFASIPVFIYAVDLLMCAVAYLLLSFALAEQQGEDSAFTRVVSSRRKEQITTISYIAAVPLALYMPVLALILIGVIALFWVLPERRIVAIAKET